MSSTEKKLSAALFSLLSVASLGAGLIMPESVQAKPGDPPKVSFFGADAMSSPFSYNEGTASYYSPYKAKGIYQPGSPAEIADRLSKITESQKRIAKIGGYIDKKEWEEVRAELDRQTYTLRDSMNRVAKASGSKDAQVVAKKFYQDIEEISAASGKKQPGPAKAAYESAVKDLDIYISIVKK
jgi:hypothetical protein